MSTTYDDLVDRVETLENTVTLLGRLVRLISEDAKIPFERLAAMKQQLADDEDMSEIPPIWE